MDAAVRPHRSWSNTPCRPASRPARSATTRSAPSSCCWEWWRTRKPAANARGSRRHRRIIAHVGLPDGYLGAAGPLLAALGVDLEAFRRAVWPRSARAGREPPRPVSSGRRPDKGFRIRTPLAKPEARVGLARILLARVGCRRGDWNITPTGVHHVAGAVGPSLRSRMRWTSPARSSLARMVVGPSSITCSTRASPAASSASPRNRPCPISPDG
jgi:hypothetical protein